MIKKALMEELPIRDAIQKLDNFFGHVEKPSENEILNREAQAIETCLLYTSPSPRDKRQSRMPSSA